ncbi:MAG: UDP-3-O-(3-hydroxymyristoyl)glucosamine N-acyltransferase [Pirellula sp.]|nr:UDP-3-O-(3-hydroxymyristoyl)glucosamine N-acyltransferase [Pirellula sp.]
MKTMDLLTLAKHVQGELFTRDRACEPDSQCIIGAAPLQDAESGQITLIDSDKHLSRLQTSKAAACVTPQSFPDLDIPQIVVKNPHEAFAQICKIFRPAIVITAKSGIDPRACVSESARIASSAVVEALASVGENCEIGEGTHIHRGVTIMDGCRIGSQCQLYPGVVLYPGTVLEDRVVLHANCVLGAHGFGYKTEQGRHVSTSQLGWVHVESDVEIGANTTVDRGTYGATKIGEGTKIDNLVQIAHNCKIGKHNLVCSQVGIAGSCTTGDYVVLAGQVGMRDHVNIGNKSIILAQSGVAEDVAENQILLGSPALPRKEQAMIIASLLKLPEMRKTLKQVERTLESMDDASGERRKAG